MSDYELFLKVLWKTGWLLEPVEVRQISFHFTAAGHWLLLDFGVPGRFSARIPMDWRLPIPLHPDFFSQETLFNTPAQSFRHL